MQVFKKICLKKGHTIKSDIIKKSIIDHFKEVNLIETPIGAITLSKVIGEGANGIVFEGEWKNQPVAIKFYCNEGGAKGRKFLRFVDEITVQLFSFDSKYIAKILYFDNLPLKDDALVPFFVMPKYEQTLKAMHKSIDKPNQKAEDIMALFYKLCTAIKDLHSRNIIHRDLKPENIFIHMDEVILGDLGICYYENDIERKAETKKGDRLANYLFSAPEQLAGAKAHFTMDIFSLGQIIQWFVHGEPHRGTYRKKITEIDKSLASLDACIDRMLINDQSKRPQSINEVEKIVRNYNKENDPVNRAYEMMDWSISFDKALRMSFPGKDGTFLVDQDVEINRLMENLSGNLDKMELWWSVGDEGNCPISKIKKDADRWVIGTFECLIKGVFVHKTPTVDREYILVWLRGDSDFPNISCSRYNNKIIAGKYEDIYIRAEEHDDGYAMISEQVVNLNKKSEIRERFLSEQFLFIAPNSNAVLFSENDTKLTEIIKKLYIEKDKFELLDKVNYLKANRLLSIIK